MILNLKNKGSLLIEVLVASAIISTSVVASLGVLGTMAKLQYRNTARIQASFLAEEGIEAVKTLRNASWNTNIKNLTLGTRYYLYWNNNTWNINTTPTVIDGQFHRYFILNNVYRNSNFDIVSSASGGAILDSDMRDMIINVDWADEAGTSSKSIHTYLYNLFAN